MDLKKDIITVLKSCYDPEIPLDLWSLGLIYDIDIIEVNEDKSKIDITMSLTTPGCSMGQHMADDIKSKVSKLDQHMEKKVIKLTSILTPLPIQPGPVANRNYSIQVVGYLNLRKNMKDLAFSRFK